MERKEYEYSLKVKSLQPVIDYCYKNGYFDEGAFTQKRTLYRNPNKTMARITINTSDGRVSKELDFKEDNLVKGSIVKEVKESLAISFTEDEAVESILEFLGYRRDNTIERTRYVFVKNDVKFELDEYTFPGKHKVVGIEGNKKKVDRVYNEVKDIIDLE